jgi:hypothetical protein
MHDLLEVIHEKRFCLSHVSAYDIDFGSSEPHQLAAIRLNFGEVVVVIVAQEDDTLAIFGAEWKPDDSRIIANSLDAVFPWNSAIGKPLMWSWQMINQQGYADGIQFEFAKDVDDSAVEIQVVAVASELIVKQVLLCQKNARAAT